MKKHVDGCSGSHFGEACIVVDERVPNPPGWFLLDSRAWTLPPEFKPTSSSIAFPPPDMKVEIK